MLLTIRETVSTTNPSSSKPLGTVASRQFPGAFLLQIAFSSHPFSRFHGNLLIPVFSRDFLSFLSLFPPILSLPFHGNLPIPIFSRDFLDFLSLFPSILSLPFHGNLSIPVFSRAFLLFLLLIPATFFSLFHGISPLSSVSREIV